MLSFFFFKGNEIEADIHLIKNIKMIVGTSGALTAELITLVSSVLQ